MEEEQTFSITEPFGLPRPVNARNVFGASVDVFCDNLMNVPPTLLEHYHASLYWPYARRIAELLRQVAADWGEPQLSREPARYLFMRDQVACAVPQDFRSRLPGPPRVTLRAILQHLKIRRPDHHALELLDFLTLVREDLGAVEFGKLTARHPWIADYMR